MRWCFAILALAACTKDEGATDSGTTTDTEPPPPPPPADTSQVRFVNASEVYGTAYLFECPLGFATAPETADPSAKVAPLTGTTFREFDSGPLGFAVAAAGSFVDCETAVTFEAVEDGFYTLWVSGTAEAPAFGYALDDAAAIPLGFARFDFHNLATGDDSVTVTAGERVAAVGFGEMERLELAAEAFVLAVDEDEDTVVDASFSIPAVAAETFARLFLARQGEELVVVAARANGTYVTIAATPPT